MDQHTSLKHCALLCIILDLFKNTQPWHSKCHYTYYLVFHQTFKHIHQYGTNNKYLYYIQY